MPNKRQSQSGHKHKSRRDIHDVRGPEAPAGLWLPRRDTFLCNSGTGALGPLWGAGVKKYTDCSLPEGSQARQGQTRSLTVFSHFWFHIWSPHWGRFPTAQPLLCPPGLPPPPSRLLGGPWAGDQQDRVHQGDGRGMGRGPAVLRRGHVGGRPAPGALRTGARCSLPSLQPLRGLSAAPLGPLGLLALSLFFLRRLSIQLELERAVKLERARELRRMFLPDMMSSPKPSWWEKA